MLKWFTDYLDGRLQRVVIDSVASQWTSVSSGVPQGSLLGPILFAIFINDFPNVVSDMLQTPLYADGSKLYKSISCVQSCETLQQSINNLNTWNHENNTTFNASKCPVGFEYHLEDETLVNVRKEKHLAVQITSHLTWDKQVLAVV